MKHGIPENRDQLPYVFDLLYDIKTVSSLYDHLLGVSRLATSATDAQLLELMRDENIAPPPGLQHPPLTNALEPALLKTRYEEAILLLKRLSRTRGALGDAEKNLVTELLAQHGIEA